MTCVFPKLLVTTLAAEGEKCPAFHTSEFYSDHYNNQGNQPALHTAILFSELTYAVKLAGKDENQ